MNKDLMAAGFLLVGVGIYAGYLFTIRRGSSTVASSTKPSGTVKLPQVVGGTPSKETPAERFNRIKHNVEDQFRQLGIKPPYPIKDL